MSGIGWARRFATGLPGKARALFHGLGRPGEHPSRVTPQEPDAFALDVLRRSRQRVRIHALLLGFKVDE